MPKHVVKSVTYYGLGGCYKKSQALKLMTVEEALAILKPYVENPACLKDEGYFISLPSHSEPKWLTGC